MKRNEPYSACNVRNGFQAFLKAHINSYNFSFGQKIKKRETLFSSNFLQEICASDKIGLKSVSSQGPLITDGRNRDEMLNFKQGLW